MSISINKVNHATGLFPWCPYVGGFWKTLFSGYTTLFWCGYRISFTRVK